MSTFYCPAGFTAIDLASELDKSTKEVSNSLIRCHRMNFLRRKRNIKSISGLLYKIARNAVIDAYRNKGKNETYSIEHAHTLPCKANQDAIEVKQEVDALLISIKRLKQEYQEAVLLRYVEELSIAEVAEIVGKSNASVRVLLHRAIKKLHSIHEE